MQAFNIDSGLEAFALIIWLHRSKIMLSEDCSFSMTGASTVTMLPRFFLSDYCVSALPVGQITLQCNIAKLIIVCCHIVTTQFINETDSVKI